MISCFGEIASAGETDDFLRDLARPERVIVLLQGDRAQASVLAEAHGAAARRHAVADRPAGRLPHGLMRGPFSQHRCARQARGEGVTYVLTDDPLGAHSCHSGPQETCTLESTTPDYARYRGLSGPR